jgi:hypothetical protein
MREGRAVFWNGVAVAALCGVGIAHAHAVEHPWKITITQSGGIASHVSRVSLDDHGILEFPLWTGDEMITVRRQQQPADVAAVEAELATLPLSGSPQPPPPPPGCCDQPWIQLTVEIGGRSYPLPPARLNALLIGMRAAASPQPDLDRARDAFWAKVGPFDPGKVLHVTEESCTDAAGKHHPQQQGEWTRRGHSNTFDLFYPAFAGHREIRDTLTLDSVVHDTVNLTRVGTGQQYQGRRIATNDESFDGSITPPGCHFTSIIER